MPLALAANQNSKFAIFIFFSPFPSASFLLSSLAGFSPAVK